MKVQMEKKADRRRLTNKGRQTKRPNKTDKQNIQTKQTNKTDKTDKQRDKQGR